MTLLALGIIIGVGLIVVLRIVLIQTLLAKLRHDVRALGEGDHEPLLKGYADDAVLSFNNGDHRWSGEHNGREGIEAFLRSFVAAGLSGEILEVFVGGWPWSMTILVRFDDAAEIDGERLYSNRTVLLCRTRWGKIVHQEDFYEDTQKMVTFDSRLKELGL